MRLRIILWEAFWHLFAAALAGAIATLVLYPTGVGHNYWAMMAAGGGQTLVDRFVETTIGAAVGVACVLFPLL